MWEPYLIVLRKKAPQAAVIFDRFHIVCHLNEAVTKVRRQLIRDADPQGATSWTCTRINEKAGRGVSSTVGCDE